MKQNKIKSYNLRVYGILLNKTGEVLISEETRGDFSFVKFPGGGHQLGEGLVDCLKREFKEELDIEIDVKAHFYTTDFFQVSKFDESEQLLSIYFLVDTKEINSIKNGRKASDATKNNPNTFYWRELTGLKEKDFTFPIDRLVLKRLKEM